MRYSSEEESDLQEHLKGSCWSRMDKRACVRIIFNILHAFIMSLKWHRGEKCERWSLLKARLWIRIMCPRFRPESRRLSVSCLSARFMWESRVWGSGVCVCVVPDGGLPTYWKCSHQPLPPTLQGRSLTLTLSFWSITSAISWQGRI